MIRKSQFGVCALLWLCSLHAETIDRIAVAVGNRVVTTSDIDRQIRIAAFLSGVKPDMSPATRRKTAEALVDQKLIRRELESSRYPEPAPAELDTIFADFKKKYFRTDDEYRRALTEYGITEGDVKEQLHWQRTWLAFIGVRFRPSVQVSDQAVQEYFDGAVAPAARAANPDGPVALDDYREQIVAKLSGDIEDRQMDLWLGEARRRTEIVWHNEAFE